MHRQSQNGALTFWPATLLIVIAIGVVYGGSLHAPFIFDDTQTILDNPSIRALSPLVGTSDQRGPLNPAAQTSTAGRPLVNLSFALNYYFGGRNPVGYHAVNVGLHFFSALLLWLIVRTTLQLPYFSGAYESSAGWLALVTSMLWAIHPLQTEAVVYVTQRTELAFAFFYLATLFCSLRYFLASPPSRNLWLIVAALASLAGMASKEAMVSAPLMVLFFDRAFISGSLATALRRNWTLYTALAATLILLLALNFNSPRSESAGFGLGMPIYAWWFTQAKVFLMYLKLSLLPWPLFIHYQWPFLTNFSQAWIYVVPAALIVTFTLFQLWRNSPVGYLATWVLAILAPTLLIPIPIETAAERRMYLPLAALATLFVVGGYSLIERIARRSEPNQPIGRRRHARRIVACSLLAVLTLTLALVSARRLRAYNDEVKLWQEVVVSQPQNFLAHTNLGAALGAAGQAQQAIDHLEIARKLKPNFIPALSNLGPALDAANRSSEAVDVLSDVLARQPNDVTVLKNLSTALRRSGRFPEAIQYLQQAAKLAPDDDFIHTQLGTLFSRTGHLPEAIAEIEIALRLRPDSAEALNILGITLLQSNRASEAIERFQRALQLKPDFADAHNNLALAYSRTDHFPQAITHYQAAIRAKPDYVQAYFNLAQCYARTDKATEAIATARQAISTARTIGDQRSAEKIEDWLTHYEKEQTR